MVLRIQVGRKRVIWITLEHGGQKQFCFRAISMTKPRLWLLFKEQTVFAPIDYFNRLRMHSACQLLDTTGMSIKAIATSRHHLAMTTRSISPASSDWWPKLPRQNIGGSTRVDWKLQAPC